jgi:hypothetical protein
MHPHTVVARGEGQHRLVEALEIRDPLLVPVPVPTLLISGTVAAGKSTVAAELNDTLAALKTGKPQKQHAPADKATSHECRFARSATALLSRGCGSELPTREDCSSSSGAQPVIHLLAGLREGECALPSAE